MPPKAACFPSQLLTLPLWSFPVQGLARRPLPHYTGLPSPTPPLPAPCRSQTPPPFVSFLHISAQPGALELAQPVGAPTPLLSFPSQTSLFVPLCPNLHHKKKLETQLANREVSSWGRKEGVTQSQQGQSSLYPLGSRGHSHVNTSYSHPHQESVESFTSCVLTLHDFPRNNYTKELKRVCECVCLGVGGGGPHIPLCLGLCPYTPGQKPELTVCPLDSGSLPRRAVRVERALNRVECSLEHTARGPRRAPHAPRA